MMRRTVAVACGISLFLVLGGMMVQGWGVNHSSYNGHPNSVTGILATCPDISKCPPLPPPPPPPPSHTPPV